MDTSHTLKSTQEQAVASWIDHLNQLRLDELMTNITQQDTNLVGALEELGKLKDFVGNPANILGNELTKHGEIAEHAQVNISNARRVIEGLKSEYSFDGVGRLATEDYLRNGTPIQAKFYNSAENTLEAVKKHFEQYPRFIENGGKYQIPKDYYDAFYKFATISPEEGGKLTYDEGRRLYVTTQKFLNDSGFDINSVEPTVVNYSDVQQDSINKTIKNEQNSINETDQNRRNQFHKDSKPTLHEGIKATAASAAIEGGMTFCLGVYLKLKSGKKISEFTAEDWKEVGIDTIAGTGRGAVRGAAIYTMTNFTRTPAAVASAMVTASFGVISQARLLSSGLIGPEEFIVNSEIVCLDVTISAISSMMGQVVIPIPVLGAVIGNASGMFMYNIAKDHLSRKDQVLIQEFNDDIQRLNEMLSAEYKEYIVVLEEEYAKFSSLTELAFDENVNVAFSGSVALTQYVGCCDEDILSNESDVDAFFLD